MDRVYDELDELKAEIEKLKEECQAKKELSESLRKAHNEQLVKYTEAKSLIEEQVQQVNAKSEEISEVRKICEDLKSYLHEKELIIRDLNLAKEKLQFEYGEKVQKLEGENKALGLALDEATARTQDYERKVCVDNVEIQGLKRLLLIAEKKCLEAEEKAVASQELRVRDDLILKMEEENRDVKDQLKWKNERFKHLEEAHKRLQDQFQLCKVEWEREKSKLVEEVCSLQSSLDSQTRILEGLQSQLKMCNQALSHEESRRKILEVEVLELRSHFDNVILECQEAKLKIEKLTFQRDEDIAELRNTLGTKETLFKDMEYRIAHLEQENQELLGSLKEFREAQIKNVGANSLKKLQNRLRGLEQLHSQCSVILKQKEAEWDSRLEKMMRDMEGYVSDLKGKDNDIQELQMKLDACGCLLEVQNEEIPVLFMVLKSEFMAAYSKLLNEKAEIEMRNKEREHQILLLREQLETKSGALNRVDGYLEQEQEGGRLKRDRIAHQECLMEELESYEKMFDELSNSQLHLKEQVLQMENALIKSSKDAFYALEKANCKLDEKILEVHRTKLELQNWKSSVEKVRVHLEGDREILKQEKENLLGFAKEKDQKIGCLQQQIALLESAIGEKQIEIDVLHEALEKAENLKKLESQDKSKTIGELETEINGLRDNLKFYEDSLLCSKKLVKKLESVLEAQESETERLKDQFRSKQENLEGLVKELQCEKMSLLEDVKKLSAEREDMLVQIEGVYTWVSDFCSKDVELMGVLGKMWQDVDIRNGNAMDLVSDWLSDSLSMNVSPRLSTSTKGNEEGIDDRSPLKELNH